MSLRHPPCTMNQKMKPQRMTKFWDTLCLLILALWIYAFASMGHRGVSNGQAVFVPDHGSWKFRFAIGAIPLILFCIVRLIYRWTVLFPDHARRLRCYWKQHPVKLNVTILLIATAFGVVVRLLEYLALRNG